MHLQVVLAPLSDCAWRAVRRTVLVQLHAHVRARAFIVHICTAIYVKSNDLQAASRCDVIDWVFANVNVKTDTLSGAILENMIKMWP